MLHRPSHVLSLPLMPSHALTGLATTSYAGEPFYDMYAAYWSKNFNTTDFLDAPISKALDGELMCVRIGKEGRQSTYWLLTLHQQLHHVPDRETLHLRPLFVPEPLPCAARMSGMPAHMLALCLLPATCASIFQAAALVRVRSPM